ncbi:hypothetical protein BU25DRAFT_413536 [Macroventuria anomochaeta]|uniref:Uncharacterized protein n=1 Tax=Macroventuria anomochaeta TaxID=301207 RepID=A0ACB6RQN0_9PLEO|nr:uncharacterized protein BU25DRAFT_413536 [Macroventuria anomochaeta]KAF2624275.1 hypothetical protein BU25DRAFT_413536 [Macroventuria anomochaeta]
MSAWEPIDTFCVLFYLFDCFGAHPILQAVQLQQVREEYNLESSCNGDIFKSLYCLCCSLMQAEKEVQRRSGTGFGRMV